MRGRNGRGIGKAVAGEIRQGCGFVDAVDLVDHQQRRTRGLAQPGQDFIVQRGGAFAAVDDEQDEVGLLGGGARLPRGRARQTLFFAGDTARVHHQERDLLIQAADTVIAIAGHAGRVVDQRKFLTDQPIEQRGFSDIRPAYDGDRKRHR